MYFRAITESQGKLIKKKLHWTIGWLEDVEIAKLTRLVDDQAISSNHARNIIEDLFLMTNPREEEAVRKIAQKEIQNIINSYT